MKNELMRIHTELSGELRKLASKNDITIIEASKLLAETLKNLNNKKIEIIEEITF